MIGIGVAIIARGINFSGNWFVRICVELMLIDIIMAVVSTIPQRNFQRCYVILFGNWIANLRRFPTHCSCAKNTAQNSRVHHRSAAFFIINKKILPSILRLGIVGRQYYPLSSRIVSIRRQKSSAGHYNHHQNNEQ